uniref:THAP-type domain-containing protein n=1 Tax=Tetraodon nigroviridis TaxID=99883 RepID=H3C514_TETNG
FSFRFPLYNPRKLKKWLANMKLKDWTPSRFSVLCINHFEEQYIDKSGKSVKLREDAVPTIFSSPEDTQKRKAKDSKTPRNKKAKVKPVPTVTLLSMKLTTKTVKLRFINTGSDAGLQKISSFPYFFHGDYCVSQDIQWAPDNDESTECKDPERLIEVRHSLAPSLLPPEAERLRVTAPWQWLGLDIRGPLPPTLSGHRYILTLADYFSKWVEAVPVESCLPSSVAKHLVDAIAHFGFPVRILSRLPHDIVQKINKELREQLKITIALVVHHQQTGSADLITQQLIDRMVNDLIEEHVSDWDVYLPAKVFSLCFKEHSQTKERPFSALCCAGLEPAQGPR